MDEVDRVANRVSLAALTGLVSGAAFATYRGAPVPRTAISVAGSFALIGTACFGTERIANVLIRQVVSTNEDKTNAGRLYASHAIGGLAGGGITGGLFQRHPVPGMLFFAPIMMTVAYAELKMEQEREKRLRELIQVNEGSVEKEDDSPSVSQR